MCAWSFFHLKTHAHLFIHLLAILDLIFLVHVDHIVGHFLLWATGGHKDSETWPTINLYDKFIVTTRRWLLNRFLYMCRGENETDWRDKTRNSPGCYQLTKVTSQKTLCRCFAVLVKNDEEMTANAKYVPNFHLDWKEKRKNNLPIFDHNFHDKKRTLVNVLYL